MQVQCINSDHYGGADYVAGEVYEVTEEVGRGLLERWKQRGQRVIHNFKTIEIGAKPDEVESVTDRKYKDSSQNRLGKTPSGDDGEASDDDGDGDSDDGEATDDDGDDDKEAADASDD